MKRFFTFCLYFMFITTNITSEIIAENGKGFLEVVDHQSVLHLKGSPYEIGFQHGTLLKNQILSNIERFIDKKLSTQPSPPIIKTFIDAIPNLIKHIPEKFLQELKGLAEGAQIPYDKILILNLFPEMFHCSAITVSDRATENGCLYHVRVLDYAAANSIQDTAILAVIESQEGNTFFNATYAGFIGCVTGINEKKIAVGEIGGKGYGSWNGIPMSFLLRQILENASNLHDVKAILQNTPRTCEYYYVFSDGKNREALAVYATAEDLVFTSPGETYSFMPQARPGEMITQQIRENQQLDDCITITRWNQYKTLVDRIKGSYGKLTVTALQEVIKQPIAHTSNLHNAIFAPETMELWISQAGGKNEPACDQPYHYFDLTELIKK